MRVSYPTIRSLSGGVLLLVSGAASAASLVTTDDNYGIRFGVPLLVEPLGVLENDTLDGENAGESGATATLISGPIFGTMTCPANASLSLCPDGSFNYTPGAGFDSSDSFTYQAEFGVTISAPATVTLTACEGGPVIYSCWSEQAFLDKLSALGLSTFQEGFEGPAWEPSHSTIPLPQSIEKITSQGITWTSNHIDLTPPNEISTGSGAARSGMWGLYDPDHGHATGSAGVCDVDNPPEHCLYYDGVSGSTAPVNSVLHAVGGYFSGIWGANISIILNGSTLVNLGQIGYAHQFFGVIDSSAAGFTHFEVREVDGKIGQALYIWADDFTFAPRIADGDVAPVGAPDGLVNTADLMVTQQLATGERTATADDIRHADFTPVGAPDQVIDTSDVLLMMRLLQAQ